MDGSRSAGGLIVDTTVLDEPADLRHGDWIKVVRPGSAGHRLGGMGERAWRMPEGICMGQFEIADEPRQGVCLSIDDQHTHNDSRGWRRTGFTRATDREDALSPD